MGLPKITSLPDPNFRNCGPCDICDARELSFCAALDVDEVNVLARILTTISADAGSVLYHEGDDARHVYNITDGCVKTHKMLPDGRLQITGFHFEGDYLGVARSDTYAASAQVVNDARLCRFPISGFETLTHEHPELQDKLFSMARDEMDALRDHMLLLGRKTARERLATFLIHLSEGQSRRDGQENPVHLPMGRGDIADYLGLTIETVSRTFTAFRKDGLIELVDKAHARLLDWDALHALAENE